MLLGISKNSVKEGINNCSLFFIRSHGNEIGVAGEIRCTKKNL